MPKAPKINPTKAAASALVAAAAPPLVNNCVWSNNNAACVNTWFCLSKDVLGQIDASFDDAATLKMTDLAYWNDLAGDDNRKVEAAALADILTKLFTNMVGATYEPGQNFASAIVAMTAVLTDANKTVCELAAVVDELHHFTTEG
jgi:alkylhydroperoxidase family enzyme